MIVNNIDILKNYDVILTGRDIQACNVVTYDEWLEASFDPIINKQKEGYSVVNTNLLIEGNTEDEVLFKISEILKLCEKGKLIFDDLNFTYNVTLEKHQEKLISDKAYELTLNFKATSKFKNEVIENLNNILTETINASGNLKTPAIVEITPSIDLIDLVLNGLSENSITIRNLQANKKIIIDGKEGTVTQEGKNKFADTDMWEFPFLLPGSNTITLSKNNCNVNIKYEPRFI